MNKILISFDHNDQFYEGYFISINTMNFGGAVWQVVLNNRFVGYLQYKEKWEFDGNSLEEFTQFFGDYLIA